MEKDGKYFCSILEGKSLDIPYLQSIVEKSSWFALSAALLIRDLETLSDIENSSKLKRDFSISFSVNSYNGINSLASNKKDKNKNSAKSLDMISGFLDKKVKPKKRQFTNLDDVNDYENDSIEEGSELIESEYFAKIMASQGHLNRAIEIYRGLCLKNPEKSVYFAVRIGELEEKIQNSTDPID